MNTKPEDLKTNEGLRILARIIARAYLADSLTGVNESEKRDETTNDEGVSRTRRNKDNRNGRDKPER